MSKQNELISSRRFLPSLTWLSAFEAVARRGSVTEAAQELSLTQGAVSRQIQKLESQIGVVLFERQKKRMHLTEKGSAYAVDIRVGIEKIVNASINLQVNPKGGPLNLAVLPAFGTYWLAPKLPDFLKGTQGVTINLSTRTTQFDFSHESIHAAIHFGKDDWPNAESLCLMKEEVIAVTSPELWDQEQLGEKVADIDLPLLHLDTRPMAWNSWLQSEGIHSTTERGFQFDQFAAMIQAAVSGLGAAIVPKYLVTQELLDGSLRHFGSSTTLGSYYLVWPKRYETYPPLLEFRQWMEGKTKKQMII